MKHVIADLHNTDKFRGIQRIFTRTKARTDEQTNRNHKYFSTLLESVKNSIELPFQFEPFEFETLSKIICV